MSYSLQEINEKVRNCPSEFTAEGERMYEARLKNAAERISANISRSPIVLLAGPSGSGKTTTAQKLGEELLKLGIKTHAISMDNYFSTLDPKTAPRDENGEIDLESPECVDRELLTEHFSELARGNEIKVPQYIFAEQKRSDTLFTPVRLEENEIAIFEGIHALNGSLTSGHREAFKLYISTASDIVEGDTVIFEHSWFRLLRRLVRDTSFRGVTVNEDLALWDNVVRGERKFIKPFIGNADMTLDSSLIYEASVMKTAGYAICQGVTPGTENFDVLMKIGEGISRVAELDEEYVPKTSMLREFIGGGTYTY